eukprot:405127_1
MNDGSIICCDAHPPPYYAEMENPIASGPRRSNLDHFFPPPRFVEDNEAKSDPASDNRDYVPPFVKILPYSKSCPETRTYHRCLPVAILNIAVDFSGANSKNCVM